MTSTPARIALVAAIVVLTIGAGPKACKDQYQVNPVVDDRDEEGRVAGHPSYGQFVAVWEHWENSVPGSKVYGQRFDAYGDATGLPFLVNGSGGRHGSPAVSMNSTGAFVVAWVEDDDDETLARRFDKDGGALTSELAVATAADFSRSSPVVALAESGAFMVVWEESVVDPSEGTLPADICARYYNSSSVPATDTMVNLTTTGDQLHPSVAALTGGGWIIVWQSGGDIKARRYAADGTSVSGELTLNGLPSDFHEEPHVTDLPGGGYAAAWRWSHATSGEEGIHLRRFSSTNAAAGAEIQVNSLATGWQSDPWVDSDLAGNLVVVWASDNSPGNDNDQASIQCQVLRADGSRFMQQFQVNTTITDQQDLASTAVYFDMGWPATGFVVVWNDTIESPPDTTIKNVQAKCYEVYTVIFADDFETGNTSRWH